MTRIIREWLQNKIIRYSLEVLVTVIVSIIVLHYRPVSGIKIIFALMILYFICRVGNKIIDENDNSWVFKAVFYAGIGIVTIFNPKAANTANTTVAIANTTATVANTIPTIPNTMLAVIALIEAFDILFENLLKNWLRKEIYYGYDLKKLMDLININIK